MPWIVGVDEAGYGPNLGPLVISTSVWQTDADTTAADLYRKLRRCVTTSPSQKASARRIAIADSKVLYQPGNGWQGLERGLWAAFALLSRSPASAADVWTSLFADPLSHRQSLPWHSDESWSVPAYLDCQTTADDATFFAAGLDRASVRLVELRSRAVFPAEFNALVERFQSKGAALTHATLALVCDVVAPLANDTISIHCDKHGGRDYYAAALQDAFADELVFVVHESRTESRYRWGNSDRPVACQFQVGGESLLPTALASMASKYLRELAMRSFNDYWRRFVPDLHATAGYPTDAKRFRTDIAEAQKRLGIADRVLWRER